MGHNYWDKQNGAQVSGLTKSKSAPGGTKLQRGGRSGEHVYSRAIEDEICRRLSEGESLSSICRTPGFPCATVVRKWVVQDRGGIGARYARAREAGWEALADQLFEISDDDSFLGQPDASAAAAQRRLAVDTRKWFLSKVLPHRFGDRVEVVGNAGARSSRALSWSRCSLGRSSTRHLKRRSSSRRPTNKYGELDGADDGSVTRPTTKPQAIYGF